jgi:uncharacterized protein (DUF1697 family)
VIFDAGTRSLPRLESSIEKALEQGLGIGIETFVRTAPEVAALARHPVVSGENVAAGSTAYVMFLRSEPSRQATASITALTNDVDRFQVHGSHAIWTIRGTLLDSTVPSAVVGKALGLSTTVRNVTTVRKLAAKFCSPK